MLPWQNRCSGLPLPWGPTFPVETPAPRRLFRRTPCNLYHGPVLRQAPQLPHSLPEFLARVLAPKSQMPWRGGPAGGAFHGGGYEFCDRQAGQLAQNNP